MGAAQRTRSAAEPRLPSLQRRFLVARQWSLMAPAMAVALLVLGLASLRLPVAATSGLALAAILLVSATPLFVRLEQRSGTGSPLRYAIVAAGIALPMLLFGNAVAQWARATGGWEAAIAVLAVIAMIAGTLLHGRLASKVAAQLALWLGVSLSAGSPLTFAVLALGAAVGVFLSWRQVKQAARDDEARREFERAQVRAEQLLAEYEQSGQGWFWETDRRGTIAYVSPRIGALVGRESEALAGRPFTELFILDSKGQEGERTLNFHLSARSSFQDLAVRAATGEDEERWWSISGRPIHDEFNNFMGFRGSGHDLTEKRRSEANASRLAHYDSLTGLANRFQMSQTLEKILNAQREEHRACSVFLLDLDRFKQVNDTLGHPAGDALLKQVAQRLGRAVDKAGRVGRLGGDEFQVILPGRTARDDLAQLASRIIESLSQPYLIEGHRVMIGASVGIALSPEDGVTSEALIRNADLALYAAKDGGRGRHHFYAADLHSDAEERRQLEQDLRDAITHGGLELHYQPVVHTTTEKITGFEALIRWTHPKMGRLSPAKFIPIAEDAGLITQIGEWALRTACQDLATWPESVRVAVNVSPLQFSNPALPAIVTSALAAAQVAPGRLELEITESVFLNDDRSTEAMFTALKGIGVRLALDDFGTGYSSLGYLKKAPFDKIKIDQSFVRGATVNGSRNGAIIASIVSLAEALGMETTAEGVETLDELDLVRVLGCSHIQGYIYEKALSGPAALARLKSGLVAVATGPRSARNARQTMLRKVVLEHGAERYEGTIRNISTTGAMIEGLWDVPPGTVFALHMAAGYVITATARWSKEDRMGVEFAVPLAQDANGGISVVPPRPQRTATESILRRTG
jgi:diguanylate cyclase (GGDEF)-like protein/PAS domain S-box-containing protein